MPRCCTECFDDDRARREITENGAVGDCDYCLAHNVPTVEPDALEALFAPLLSIYEPTEAGRHYDHRDSDALTHGDPLAHAINYDWGIFSDRLVDQEDNLHRLVEDIFSGLFDYKDCPDLGASSLWTPKERSFFSKSPEESWDEFATHVKRRRRFLIGELPVDVGDVRDLLREPTLEDLAVTIQSGSVIYRARPGVRRARDGAMRPLPTKELGAPPVERARAGRAGVAGIPVLYAARDVETAIADRDRGRERW